MTAVTMIQQEQAVVGHEYVFNGGTIRCQGCRVKGVCLNQRKGRRYKIVKLRDVKHHCLLNDDLVRVVEVEPSAPPTCIERRSAIEGSTIAFQSQACQESFCKYSGFCHPIGLESGMKIRILEVGSRINCPNNLDLVRVRIAYAPD